MDPDTRVMDAVLPPPLALPRLTATTLTWAAAEPVEADIGDLLRGAALGALATHDPGLVGELSPHDGRAQPWWLRCDRRQPRRLQVVLVTTDRLPPAAGTALGEALAGVDTVVARDGRRCHLGPATMEPMGPAIDCWQQAGAPPERLLTLEPVILTRGRRPLTRLEFDLADLVRAACSRLATVAGAAPPRPGPPWPSLESLRGRREGLQAVRRLGFPYKGRRLTGLTFALEPAAMPESVRRLVVAGCLLNLGRCPAIGAGTFVPG